MGCINKKLPINLQQMKKVLLKEIDYIINDKLYFLDIMFESLKNDIKKDEEKYNNKIKKLKDNMIKEIGSKFDSDNFIYNIIDDNHCTFKHTRGKNDGKFCCKNITINGNKKKYICRIHNKEHIAKKKINKLTNLNIRSTEAISNNIIIEKDKNNKIISDNIRILQNDKNSNKTVNIKKNIENNNKFGIIKKNKENLRNKYNKNIIINNFNVNSFRKIVNNYNYNNNSIYIYNKQNNITLLDFIPEKILSY
jgi:hypothetical protein